jgi:FKBP-type peptidyl-prolyl cis-trans isomerase
VTVPLSNVIPAWTEALQLVKTGGKIKVWAPSSLAFGERGGGAKIPPNATLVFDLELVGIQKPEAKAPAKKK